MEFLLCILLVGVLIQLSESVVITILYGPYLYIRRDFPSNQLVHGLKLVIANEIGICAADQHIIDMYPNKLQDNDGWAEYLDSKRLSDYGITEHSKGKVLAALRKVTINNWVVPQSTQLIVAYAGNSCIRINLDGHKTVKELKEFLAVKLDILYQSQIVISWYANNLMTSDGGVAIDARKLSEYGMITGSKGQIIYVGISYPNNYKGTLTVYYGNGLVQTNVPIQGSTSVWEFKNQMWALTGVLPMDMLCIDWRHNPVQDSDDGVMQDWKKMSDYGYTNDAKKAVIILNRGSHSTNTY